MKTNETYVYDYPHPAVTTDCVMFCFDGTELKVLLVERGVEPHKGKWALPGGFMKINETAEKCALRELREETGLTPKYIDQFFTYSDVKRDPRERVLSVAFFALVRYEAVKGGSDARDAKWFPMSRLPKLAFDHAKIISDAREALKRKFFFEPVGFDLLDEKFSIPSVQRLYESVLDMTFDKRNFTKRILKLGIVEKQEKRTGGEKRKGRMPMLYTLNMDKYNEMKEKHNYRFEF